MLGVWSSSCRGILLSRMLLALICDPQTESRGSPTDAEVSEVSAVLNRLFDSMCDRLCSRQLQASLSEYLDAACSLLFELLLFGYQVSSGRTK